VAEFQRHGNGRRRASSHTGVRPIPSGGVRTARRGDALLLFYQLFLAAATLVSAASAGLVYAQAPERRPSHLLSAVLMLGACWSGAELAVTLASSAADALLWMRLGTLGWVPMGALMPHLVLASLDQSSPAGFRPYRPLLRRVAWLQTGWLLVMLPASLTSGLVLSGAAPRTWGWGFHTGPLVQVNYAIVTAGVICSSFVIARCSRGASVAESLQLPWVWIGIVVPTSIVFTTDVLLPGLGVDFPRLGGASIAVTGLVVSWTVLHFGMSMITPPGFGDRILETIDEGVAVVSPEGSVVRANRALARMSGYPHARLEGMDIAQLLGSADPGELESGLGPQRLRHARGELLPVSVSTGVLRERQDNAIGVVVVVRDLRELEDLRRSSMVNARMAAVGQLAAGLAHEINNPVAFVGANLRLLQGHWDTLTRPETAPELRRDLISEGRDLIGESLEGVERAAEIVRGVKNFIHTGSSERLPARLEDLVADCLRMLRPQLEPGVEVHCDFGELPAVLCSPGEIEQVFLNLLVNAVQAVGGRGRIEVSTRLDADLAVVCFRDDGPGIEPEVMDRIFDPFFTTKPAGEGTGLGLGLAHQVVTRHGRVITVQSRPGHGATFRVHLPVGPR